MQKKYTDQEVQEWYQLNNSRNNGGYNNPDDLNLIVRKKNAPGRYGAWNLNMGNPKSYILIGLVIAISLILIYFLF